jgi:hypothetical protein
MLGSASTPSTPIRMRGARTQLRALEVVHDLGPMRKEFFFLVIFLEHLNRRVWPQRNPLQPYAGRAQAHARGAGRRGQGQQRPRGEARRPRRGARVGRCAPHPVRSAACVEGPCERLTVQCVGPPRGACCRVRACTDAILSAVESKCTSLQSEAERMATTVRYALRRSPRAVAPRGSQLPERTRQSYHEAARKLTCSSGSRSQFKVQLSKLPQKVRNMTVAEFFAQVVARRCPEREKVRERETGALSLFLLPHHALLRSCPPPPVMALSLPACGSSSSMLCFLRSLHFLPR